MIIPMQSKTRIQLTKYLNYNKLTNHSHIRAKHFMIHLISNIFSQKNKNIHVLNISKNIKNNNLNNH